MGGQRNIKLILFKVTLTLINALSTPQTRNDLSCLIFVIKNAQTGNKTIIELSFQLDSMILDSLWRKSCQSNQPLQPKPL